MASEPPTERPCPVTTIDRGRPFPVRYGELTLRAAGAARGADVIYASATYAAAAGASVGARRPLVAKLVSDPAYERARRWGLFAGTLEEFQRPAEAPGGAEAGADMVARSCRNAGGPEPVPRRYRTRVGARIGSAARRPESGAACAGADGDRAAGARLRRPTDASEGDARCHRCARVCAGGSIDGDRRRSRPRPPRAAHAECRTERPSALRRLLPRAEVLDALAGAEAAVLSSDWENFPHAAVESLAVGTPLVATAVGGVGEIVVDGVNGLLVPPGSPEAFGHALERLLGHPNCVRAFRTERGRRSRSWGRIASTGASNSCCRRRAPGDERSGERPAPADPHGRAVAIQPAASGVACPEVRRARARARRPCRRVGGSAELGQRRPVSPAPTEPSRQA